MSASSSGRRSNQRSARLRMFRVATCRRSIGLPQLGGWVDRDRERERAAGSLGRFDPDPAAVLLDDVAGDGQAETGPAALAADPRPVDLVEPLEDARLGRPRDADAVVRDRHHDVRRHRSDGDRDGAAVGAELDRVVEQVDEDLLEARLVAADGRHRLGDHDGQGDPLPFGEQAQALRRVLGDLAQVERVHRRRAPAPLSIRDRSSSSLTIWTRWPVSTSISRSGRASAAARPSRRPRHRGRASRPAG